MFIQKFLSRQELDRTVELADAFEGGRSVDSKVLEICFCHRIAEWFDSTGDSCFGNKPQNDTVHPSIGRNSIDRLMMESRAFADLIRKTVIDENVEAGSLMIDAEL